MKGIMLRGAVAAAAIFVTIGASSFTRSASADVWVLTDQRLVKYLASGRTPFSLPYEGRRGQDQLEIDSHDGSVWFYGRTPPTPPPDGKPWFNAWRLAHVTRDGALLMQTMVLDGFGLAVDRARGGVWISRPEGRTDPTKLPPLDTPAELLLLDAGTGRIEARVHGFRPQVLQIELGADGAIWVQHWGGTDSSWTRLDGTLEELDGYDVSARAKGPHHRRVDFGTDVESANAVNPSDGSLWMSRISSSARGRTPEVVKVSPEGLLLGTFTPRSFDNVRGIAIDWRNGGLWLADAPYPEDDPAKGGHVAHYSAAGKELVTAKHWDAIEQVTVDMTDRRAWVVVAEELDPNFGGPRSVVKLDAEGSPLFADQFDYDERVVQIASYAPGSSTIEIDIDVGPTDRESRVDVSSDGNVNVALLSTREFEASRTRSDTVRFGTAGAVSRAHWLRDVNGDGLMDFVQQFRIAETGIKCGDTQAVLTGKTSAGPRVHGVGSIKTIGCASR